MVVRTTIIAFKDMAPHSLVHGYECFTMTVKVSLVTIYQTTWHNIPEYDSLNIQAQISQNGDRLPAIHVYGYFIRQESFTFFSSFTLHGNRILLASCDEKSITDPDVNEVPYLH